MSLLDTINNSLTNCPRNIIQILTKTVEKSKKIAFSNGYSSLLVGAGNESDEESDVALWLGKGDYHEASNVLKALGLEQWANTIRMEAVEKEMTDGLDNAYSFRIQMEDSRVVFILIGQIEDQGWGGFVGIGVWT